MHETTFATNGATGGASEFDADLDLLYAWAPPMAPQQPLPEAAFSLTLKGTLDGVEALLTARGQTAAEFKANLEAIRGLLDRKPTPALPQAQPERSEGWCAVHGVEMRANYKEGHSWFSHKTEDGWCKGRVRQ